MNLKNKLRNDRFCVLVQVPSTKCSSWGLFWNSRTCTRPGHHVPKSANQSSYTAGRIQDIFATPDQCSVFVQIGTIWEVFIYSRVIILHFTPASGYRSCRVSNARIKGWVLTSDITLDTHITWRHMSAIQSRLKLVKWAAIMSSELAILAILG